MLVFPSGLDFLDAVSVIFPIAHFFSTLGKLWCWYYDDEVSQISFYSLTTFSNAIPLHQSFVGDGDKDGRMN